MTDEPITLTTATITIRHIISAEGGDAVVTEIENDEGELPPILEVLGMLDMAHTAVVCEGGIYDQDGDGS